MGYLTVAPLVLVRVPGAGADYRVDYHYAGSPIPWLSDTQREHLLSKGMVVEVDGDTESHHDSGRPKQTATKDVWVEYRVGQGLDRDEAEALTKQELIDFGE